MHLVSKRLLEDATIETQAAGSRNDEGEFVPGATTQRAVKLASAPLDNDMRDVLPEGARLDAGRDFYIPAATAAQLPQPLRVGDGQTDGDVIVYRGSRYRILEVSDWTPHGYVHAVGLVPSDPTAWPAA